VTREHDETLGEGVDRSHPSKHGELTNRDVHERQSKPCVHELDELVTCWLPPIKLHPMKPQLGVIKKVEHGKGYPLVFRRAMYKKESFTTV
jgi:hypothetical protein